MITLRYHIVSVVAVFLALGLGILLGSSVVSGPLEARLHADLERAIDARGTAQREAREVGDEITALRRRLAEETGPWSVFGRLDGESVVFVVDAPDLPRWGDHVVDSIVGAGATSSGTVLLGDRFALEQPDDSDDLIAAVRESLPTFEPSEDVASSALDVLGEQFLSPTGSTLIDSMVRAGFVTVEGRPDGAWPPPGSSILFLSVVNRREIPPWRLAFARSVAADQATLVVTDGVELKSVVTELRRTDDLPTTLATFDAATEDTDPGGLGLTAAMLAAIEARGGHFGTERGRQFVPPPTQQE